MTWKIDTIRSGFPAISWAHMYVLEDDGEVGLVDACVGSGYGRLRRVLRGRRPAWVFLTHWHFDHAGWLARLVDDYDLTVYCSADSAAFLMGRKRWHDSYFWQAAGRWWVRPAWGLLSALWPIRPVERVEAVAPGDALALGGARWQVVDLAGHTRGSLGLHHLERRVLFSGDAVFMNREGCIHPTYPFLAEDIDLLAESFRRVEAMDLEAIYPGHDHYGRVRPA